MLKYEFPSSSGVSDYTGDTYTNLIPTPINVGGITIGDTFNSKTMQEMFDLLLYPEMFPTLTAPSSGFSLTQAGLHEINEIISTLNFSSSFNRGSISPAYGTSGYRSGLPTQYNYGGGLLPATVVTNSLLNNQTLSNLTVSIGNRTWTMTVNYGQGEQPLSSKGNLYNSPLPAGATGSRSVTITGVYPYFATTVNITTLTKQPLALMNSSYVQTNVVVEANPNKQIVDFPVA